MNFSRRELMRFSGFGVASAGLGLLSNNRSLLAQAEEPNNWVSDPLPCFVSTWNFGKQANERSREVLSETNSILDAVERGIQLTEADASNGSVGIGGVPNADGLVQLDACIMYGPGQKAGSVAALSGIAHPISVARCVMEESRHVMLVGEGAKKFAIKNGFEEVDLLTPKRKEAWLKWKQEQSQEQRQPQPVGHDTIALLGVDDDGTVAGGCSTSGMGYKLPGRVGDSPIFGSGLYVDNEVGGAGATGVGENVMRFCGSFMVVEAMRHEMPPAEACESAIRRIARLSQQPFSELHINFVAINKRGEHGAAGTDKSFQYAVTTPDHSEVRDAVFVT